MDFNLKTKKKANHGRIIKLMSTKIPFRQTLMEDTKKIVSQKNLVYNNIEQNRGQNTFISTIIKKPKMKIPQRIG